MAKKGAKEEETRGLWGRLRGRFGAIARGLGFVGDEDVGQALDSQKERKAAKKPHKKIGRILVERGKMKDGHVGNVLKEQKKSAKKGAGKAGTKAAKKAPKKAPKKAKAKKAVKKKAKKKTKR